MGVMLALQYIKYIPGGARREFRPRQWLDGTHVAEQRETNDVLCFALGWKLLS